MEWQKNVVAALIVWRCMNECIFEACNSLASIKNKDESFYIERSELYQQVVILFQRNIGITLIQPREIENIPNISKFCDLLDYCDYTEES